MKRVAKPEGEYNIVIEEVPGSRDFGDGGPDPSGADVDQPGVGDLAAVYPPGGD